MSPRAQQDAARLLAKRVIGSLLFKRSKRIAFYLAADGEIDPRPVIAASRKLNKRVFLPVLHPLRPNRLWFYEYKPASTLQRNRFGIWEPSVRHNRKIPAWALDMVAAPLVAFDHSCHRMGMGGGFYDRTFAANIGVKRPTMIGFAHQLQCVEQLSTNPWDVPLDGVVTDQRSYHARTRLDI